MRTRRVTAVSIRRRRRTHSRRCGAPEALTLATRAAVDEFLRFYVAVGLFHNRNLGRNPLTNALVPMYVDFIAMLDDWVEQGKVPADTQVLSDIDAVPPFTVRATFPMCRYPMYPRYHGSGDPTTATSYTCTRP